MVNHLNIEAFILCWNEERIIRHTLNHYSMFCNKITVLDNHSNDTTIKIINEFFPETTIACFDTNNEIRDDIYLQVKNNCWKESKADYVIVCDADEFLYAENIIDQLDLLYQNKVILPVIIGYNMGSIEFPDNFDIPIYKQVEYGIRDRGFDKQILFSPHHVTAINYTPGCHSCAPVFNNKNVIDKVVEFKLLHFKYLGREYLYKKHEAYSSRISAFNRSNGFGREYLLGNKYIDECFSNIETFIYKII